MMKVDTDSLEKLNLLTRDAAERAGNALATAVDDSTHIGATKIRLVNHEDIVADLLSASEACLQFDLDGPLSGTILLAADETALGRITAQFDADAADGIPESALLDLSETMMAEFVTDWETHLGDDLAVTGSRYVEDPDTYDFEFESTGPDSDSAPVFQSRIHWLHEPANITLYLVPDRDSLERLLTIEDVDIDEDDDTEVAADGMADAFGDAGGDDAPDGVDAGDDGDDDEAAGDDPFGGGDASEADAENDPFGGDDDEEDSDPFGDGDDDSPFGGGSDDDNPFASGDDEGDSPFDTSEDSPFASADDADGGGAFDTDDDSFAFGEDDEDAQSLPLDKLSVFSDLTKEGTIAAADRVTQMTGVDIDTEIAGISFTPVDDISGQLEGGEYVGTTMEFEGTPSGYLVILFPEASAANIAEEMMPMEPEGEGLTEMHESAIEELCNIMTSGFIDGWANVLQNAVEHTPPEYVENMDMALVEIVTEQLGPFQTHAYTIESHMKTDEIEFDCEIHALPNEADLGEALEDLVVDRKDQTEADPSDLF
jgi:chemotaxis protein CheY-P-specific phosphatase CheC